MCYHCATNPSIMAMSSLLSHHSVTFTVALSRCRLHVSHGFVVAIMVLPSHQSWFCVHHRGVAFMLVVVSLLPLWCRLCHRIVVVSSSQLRCCGAFAVASLWFHRHHCSVAFIIALSQCSLPFHHCRHGVAFIIASSRCRHRGFVVVVLLSPFCCCGFVIAVLLLWFCCCCFVVAVLLLFSLLYHCGRCCCIVVVVVEVMVVSWLWARCSCCGCHSCCCVVVVVLSSLLLSLLHRGDRGRGHGHIIAVSSWSLLLRCGHHCCIMVVMVVVVVVVALWLWLLLCHGHRYGCCIVVVLLWSSWSWLWSCRSHCCVVSTKSRLSRRPSVFWPGVESQNTTIRRIIGMIECDVPPLVIFVITSSHRHHVIIVALSQCHVTLSPLLCCRC